MEAAVTSVKHLSRNILPDRPHLLSNSPDRRYPASSDAAVLEEWNHRGLQYMTFLSDADRGVLLTRSYHDMRDDSIPSCPAKRPVTSTAAAATTTTTTVTPAITSAAVDKRPAAVKLSLSDYTNKQRRPPSHDRRDGPDEKSNIPSSSNGTSTKEGPHSDLPGTLDRRKRSVDATELDRLQKRPKPEAISDILHSSSERLRTPKDDSLRLKDQSSAQDKSPLLQGRQTSRSLASNGRASGRLAGTPSIRHEATPTPSRGHSRSNSVNGNIQLLYSAAGLGKSSASTMSNVSSTLKPFMPALMSPLHIPIRGQSNSNGGPYQEQKRDGGREAEPQRRHKHLDTSSVIKQTNALPLPPLVSPTLPPLLEAELERLKKPTPPHHPPFSVSVSVTSVGAKHLAAATGHNTTDSEAKSVRRSFVITLKISKRIRDFQRLMALQPRQDKEKRRETEKKTLNVSAARDPSDLSTESQSSIVARKRPVRVVAAADVTSESAAKKRPRSSPPGPCTLPPATPSKASAVTIRIDSGTSRPRTPADSITNLTPGVAPPSGERHGSLVANGVSTANLTIGSIGTGGAKLQMLRQRWQALDNIARRLKHARDALVKPFVAAGEPTPDSDRKLAGTVGIESIMAFMGSFRTKAELNALRGIVPDIQMWNDVIKLIKFLLHDRSHYRPLNTILLQLNALCHEELIRCYTVTPAHTPLDELPRHERHRSSAWRAAHDALTRPDESAPQVSNLGPWSSVEDATAAALRALRRWATVEGVPWTPELPMPADDVQ